MTAITARAFADQVPNHRQALGYRLPYHGHEWTTQFSQCARPAGSEQFEYELGVGQGGLRGIRCSDTAQQGLTIFQPTVNDHIQLIGIRCAVDATAARSLQNTEPPSLAGQFLFSPRIWVAHGRQRPSPDPAEALPIDPVTGIPEQTVPGQDRVGDLKT